MTEAVGGEHESRNPAVLVIVVVAVVAVALAAFFLFRREAVRAVEYSVSQGGRVMLVGADACEGDAQIHAEETSDAVTIHATAERQWFGAQAICAVESLPVELDQPLGDRTVLDGLTGDPVSESSPR